MKLFKAIWEKINAQWARFLSISRDLKTSIFNKFIIFGPSLATQNNVLHQVNYILLPCSERGRGFTCPSPLAQKFHQVHSLGKPKTRILIRGTAQSWCNQLFDTGGHNIYPTNLITSPIWVHAPPPRECCDKRTREKLILFPMIIWI